MIFINGEPREEGAGKILTDVLAEEEYKVGQVAVEINGEIISRSSFAETVVQDGDHMEVVSFVGGG